MKTLACWLALSACAWAVDPVAKLSGPARVEPRAQVLLDPAGTAAEGEPDLELARGPAPVAVVPLYDRRGALVYALASPAQPGRYLFVLVAHGPAGPDGRAARAYAFHEVVVGEPAPAPTPTPVPTPTPGPAPKPPAPGDELSAFVLVEALKVAQPPEHRALVARALAQVYRGTAAQAVAGGFADASALMAAHREALRACLGSNLDAWKPMLDALKGRLEEDVKAGRLAASPAALGAAYVRVAVGLEAVAP